MSIVQADSIEELITGVGALLFRWYLNFKLCSSENRSFFSMYVYEIDSKSQKLEHRSSPFSMCREHYSYIS